MKNFLIRFALLTFPVLLITSCSNGELEQQILILSKDRATAISQKDSLVTLLTMMNQEMTTKSLQYEEVVSEQTDLETRNKSLRSSLSVRTQALKMAEQAYQQLDSTLALTEEEKDTLRKEIAELQQSIAAAEAETAEEVRAKHAIAQAMKAVEEKSIADSLALAAMKESIRLKQLETGFVHFAEVGGAFGLGIVDDDYATRIISLDYVFGYHINRSFMTGLGTGVNFYNGGAMIPLYADVRYYFNENKNTPFVVADGGVLFSLEKLDQSGIFINPMIGVRRELKKDLFLHLEAGLHTQFAPAGQRHSFINLKAGISFRGR